MIRQTTKVERVCTESCTTTRGFVSPCRLYPSTTQCMACASTNEATSLVLPCSVSYTVCDMPVSSVPYMLGWSSHTWLDVPAPSDFMFVPCCVPALPLVLPRPIDAILLHFESPGGASLVFASISVDTPRPCAISGTSSSRDSEVSLSIAWHLFSSRPKRHWAWLEGETSAPGGLGGAVSVFCLQPGFHIGTLHSS